MRWNSAVARVCEPLNLVLLQVDQTHEIMTSQGEFKASHVMLIIFLRIMYVMKDRLQSRNANHLRRDNNEFFNASD